MRKSLLIALILSLVLIGCTSQDLDSAIPTNPSLNQSTPSQTDPTAPLDSTGPTETQSSQQATEIPTTPPETTPTQPTESTPEESQPPITEPEETNPPINSVEKVPNMAIAVDQIKERVVIYDFDQYDEGDRLDDLEVWSLPVGHCAGVKYREDTVFGDVIIVSGKKSAIYEYPSKRVIWSTKNPGNNPHSIEILPSGNIVIASSTGKTVRLFHTSAILDENDTTGGQDYIDYELKGARGVLWDPEYNTLWAIGSRELVAYSVVGSGKNERLERIEGLGFTVYPGCPSTGHDITPDYTDSRYLYFAAGAVFRYDKKENTYAPIAHSETFFQTGIRGFSNNPNGHFYSTGPLGGTGKFFENSSKESWLTDTIIYYWPETVDGQEVIRRADVVSGSSAFYKVRAFYGKYQ